MNVSEYADVFEDMLFELESNSLKVCLVPAPEQRHRGHMIRAVQDRNPAWYRELCARYQSNRTGRKGKYKKHGDTKVKRQHVIFLLNQLAQGKLVKSKYTDFLIDTAKEIEKQFEPDSNIPF